MIVYFFSLILFFFSNCFAVQSYSLQDKNGVPLDIKFFDKVNIRNGVFVEVGAHDGVTQSNTKLLEEFYGWTGVLVEPSPSLWRDLRENRPLSKCYSCALGSFDEHNTYVDGDFNGALMSSVSGSRLGKSAEYRVVMKSLQSILDELNITHVDFFSLDVEGYEYNVLKGINYSKTIFDYLLIEVYSKDYNLIVEFLEEKGFKLIENFSLYDKSMKNWDASHNDYLFKRKEL